MTKALSWILVTFTLAIGSSEQYSAFGIADHHINVAKGKRISRSDVQDIIYDQKSLVDGKDSTTSYLYFPRSLTITIDLGDSYTVRHVLIKINPASFREVKSITARLSYARHYFLPTLYHLFRADECTTSKKNENDFFIITLFRCCGQCCEWKLRGIGRFLNVTFEKKEESNSAFGVREIEVGGLKASSGFNLALFKPVLEEHNASCMASPFVANDAWTDELFAQVKRPPFRWRVDLGKAKQLGYVRFVYKGKWGPAKVVLLNDQGVEQWDANCPLFRVELRQKNRICCDTSAITSATRWLEVRGERSLPQLVEVFIYPRGFKLYLSECPKMATTISTTTLSTTTTSTTSTTTTTTTLPTTVTSRETLEAPRDVPAATSEKPLNHTISSYSVHPASSTCKPNCDNLILGVFFLLTAFLAIPNEIT